MDFSFWEDISVRDVLRKYSERIQSSNNQQILLQTLPPCLFYCRNQPPGGKGIYHTWVLLSELFYVVVRTNTPHNYHVSDFKKKSLSYLGMHKLRLMLMMGRKWSHVIIKRQQGNKLKGTGSKVRKWLITSLITHIPHKPFLSGATHAMRFTVETTEQFEGSCKHCFS